MRLTPIVLAICLSLETSAAPFEPYHFLWRGLPCRGSEIHRTIAHRDLAGLKRVLEAVQEPNAAMVIDNGDLPRLVIGPLEFAVERGWWEGVQALLADPRVDPNPLGRGIPPLQTTVLNQEIDGNDSHSEKIAPALAKHPKIRINDVYTGEQTFEPLLLTLARLERNDVIEALRSAGHRFNALAFRRAIALAPYEIPDRRTRQIAVDNLQRWSRQNFLFPRVARACSGVLFDLREFFRPKMF